MLRTDAKRNMERILEVARAALSSGRHGIDVCPRRHVAGTGGGAETTTEPARPVQALPGTPKLADMKSSDNLAVPKRVFIRCPDMRR
jgi:hypothetical protein